MAFKITGKIVGAYEQGEAMGAKAGGWTSLATAQARATAAKPAATAATGTGVTGTAADVGLLRSTTSDILGLRAAAAKNENDARAEEISAAGYSKEAEAYGKAAGVVEENTILAGIQGDIKQLQTARAVQKTIGSQKAAIAGAGFTGLSGTSLDLMRSSMQEGYLADQIISTQTALDQGGYRQEGAAITAQGEAAQYASESATQLAAAHRSAGTSATANAALYTDALHNYILTAQSGQPLTAAQTLALNTLGDSSFSAEALGLPAAITTATSAALETVKEAAPLTKNAIGLYDRIG